MAAQASTQPPPLSRGKRIAFTAVMLCIPVLVLGMVEGGLRLAGYGDDYPLFIPVDEEPSYLWQNEQVARRYFANLAEVPNAPRDFFLAEKEPGSFRIFVQGGSSAAGFPFYYGGAFSRMLEQRLIQTFPDQRVEVVNTAMAAVNSYTLLDFVDEIIAQQPDAVLIYAGHNEYYGALGVGSSQTVGKLPAVTRAYVGLVHLRTVQLLRELIASAIRATAGQDPGEAPSGTLMERMVGEQSIPYGSPLYEMGLRQFRENLSRILAAYQEHGIPVLIGTVASNERDHRPFISRHSDGADTAAVRAHLAAAEAAGAGGDVAAALAEADAAIRADSASAAAHFLKGHLLEQAGRFAEAREAYVAARDRDELRFRAPEAVNRIIREEAARHGATVVETREALANASPQGIIGHELITEHLHPNVEGYFVLADAFYEALRQGGYVGDWGRYVPAADARAEVLLTPVDSLVGVFRLRSLMSQWPFQPPGVVDRSMHTYQAKDTVEQIALDLFREETSWYFAMDRQRRHFEVVGDLHRALQVALASVQEYPFASFTYLAAGNVLVMQRRYDEALTYFQAANDLEVSAASQTMIGSILLRDGRQAEAIAHLERAVALDPQHRQALYNLSGAYALTKQYGRARDTVGRLLKLAPEHADGRRLLASLPPVQASGK